jgi:hypothetical protein
VSDYPPAPRDDILAQVDMLCAMVGLDPHDVETWARTKGAILAALDAATGDADQ